MSTPFEPNQGPIGVDNEISLLKHEQQPQNDQVMHLFLNQVADYNTFDHHQPQQGSSSSSNSNSGHNNNNNNNNNNVFAAHKDSAIEEFITLPNNNSNANKKGKQKSKEGGHTSLLQVLTNPLLHAIPILARNCLNFEDFLAQTSMPGHNGLLGSMDELDNHNAETDLAPSPMIKSDTPWHIRVLGLPHTGAKSRVETQIKICLQLVDAQGELATNWSHIKLPGHLVAKDKLKRRNQKYGPEEKATLIESQVLSLEAAVVCESHPDDQIIMCPSCVHRERKRLKRKRDNKVARAANKEGGAAKLAALLSSNDLPDLSDEQVMAEERKRILLFNCNDFVEFNSGEATIPTRITCYCRHHSEKIGFRIVFALKDHMDQVLATGRSPPIMITDDHKSSKVQQQAAARKRNRADMDMSATESDVPGPSATRRRTDVETDSAISSPVASTPPTPSSQNDPHPFNPQHHNNNDLDLSNNELYDFLNSNDLNLLHTPQSSTPQHHPPKPSSSSQIQQQQQQQQPQQHHQQHQHPLNTNTNTTTNTNNHSHSLSHPPPPPPPDLLQQQHQHILFNQNPIIHHRLIPTEGPAYNNGSEVNVLGPNAYQGSAGLMNENPSVSRNHCWKDYLEETAKELRRNIREKENELEELRINLARIEDIIASNE